MRKPRSTVAWLRNAVAEFMHNLAAINAVADVAPGFVWRLQDEAGNATGIAVTDDDLSVINLSVWESVADLEAYVYHSDHTPFIGRRGEWFDPHEQAHMTMWWLEAGHIPSIDEAVARLEMVRRDGPTAQAFTFKQMYPAPA